MRPRACSFSCWKLWIPIDRRLIQLAVGHELFLLERTGVGFQGDFDIAGKRDTRFNTLEQAPRGLRAEQAGCAAAEKYRAQLTATALHLQLPTRRTAVQGLQGAIGHVRAAHHQAGVASIDKTTRN